jgi:stearoyl-CoA desaturase (Delta-9 desaturase)
MNLIDDMERIAAARIVQNERLRLLQKFFAFPTTLIPAAGLVWASVQLAQGKAGAMEITLLAVMYVLTTAGVVVGFHRHFTHHAFKAGTAVRAALAVLGSMAAQGPIVNWVSNHRRHHRHSDEIGDPHSPYLTDEGQPLGALRGFWHSHVGWLFDGQITNAVLYSRDLLRDPMVARINRSYVFWLLLGVVLPAAAGGLWTKSWEGALQGLLWGGLARMALNQQAIWTIGSLGHIFGARTFDTGEHEQSRNNFWVTLPILGDGWHNNHHAFPQAAIVQFEWWQLDPAGWIIRGLEKLGLAWNVIGVPSASVREQKRRPVCSKARGATEDCVWKRQRN